MIDDITVRRVAGAEAPHLVDALADVLIDCVEGGASVGFMLPLPRERALAFWRGVADAAVQLVLALPDNQPHRGDVAKMLVRGSSRRRGVARRLLAAVEDAARAEGRSVLVLDAVTGGDAERLYARHGWQRVGEVPKFALMPDGARYCATTFMYRPLD